MRVTVVCVVLCISTLTYSQIPKPCSSPAAWSGNFFQRDRFRQFSNKGEIIYDADNERVVYMVEYTSRGETGAFYDLKLYKEGLQFIVDRETLKCNVTKLDGPFQPIRVPVNATFDGEFYIGTSDRAMGDGMLVQSWYEGRLFGYYEILVTADGCIPVSEALRDILTAEDVETFYDDIVGGIIDPEVFVPPKQCYEP